jgi:hypothetical protein
VLALLERISPALAPVSAGQLAVFLNDGQAKDNASTLAPGHTFARIDEMIAELIADV